MNSAKQSVDIFPGSTLLIQNSGGHTTIVAPSVCTAGYVRDYFLTGTLPKNGTVCEPDELPFGLTPNNNTVILKRVEVDQQLKKAVKKASQAWGRLR